MISVRIKHHLYHVVEWHLIQRFQVLPGEMLDFYFASIFKLFFSGDLNACYETTAT